MGKHQMHSLLLMMSIMFYLLLFTCVPPGNPSVKSWGTAVLIETNNAGSASNPQLACNGAGNTIAVWQQYDGTRDNIWANTYR